MQALLKLRQDRTIKGGEEAVDKFHKMEAAKTSP